VQGKCRVTLGDILSDPEDVARRRLQAFFGVDFGEPGKRNLDVV